MTLMIWMMLTNAHGGAVVYVGTGVSVAVAKEGAKLSLLLESDVRELAYLPAAVPADFGECGVRQNCTAGRRVTAADVGAFLQVRVGMRSSVAVGGLLGVTRVDHWLQLSGPRRPNRNEHEALWQTTAEVGLSIGSSPPGLHLGGSVAHVVGRGAVAMPGVRGRAVWTPSDTTAEVDALVKASLFSLLAPSVSFSL